MTRSPRRPKQREARIRLKEWMDAKGFSDESLASALKVARETVTRYRKYPHRMNTDKMAEIADILGIHPGQLWHLPTRESIDAVLRDSADDIHKKVLDIARDYARLAVR